ncbi:MAG: pilus assembly protein TadG-related protein [Parahaliea sp.]
MTVRSRGQILPLILFCLVIAGVLMVIMFNVTQKVTDKTVASNASDAAVYSGGVWAARQLNYMAYTNRAMIANHVAAGHLIAYVSWTEYIEKVADNINDIGQYIPYVQVVTRALDAYAGIVKTAAEVSAYVLIPGIDTVNGLYAASQLQAKFDLNPTRVEAIMSEVVEVHDPVLRFNNTSDLGGSTGSSYQPQIDLAIAQYRAKLVAATEIASPGSDDNEMSDMVELSYAGSEEWLNNREWTWTLAPGIKLRKSASTEQELNGGLGNWEAEDELELGTWSGKWNWNTIGEGDASSDDADPAYAGIRSYARKSSGPDEELYIDLVALSTKFDNETVARTVMDIDSKGTVISGYSKARVYFEMPETGFLKNTPQYSNLYNPFWKAKLVAPWP